MCSLSKKSKQQFQLLKQINEVICEFCYPYGVTPPKCFQIRNNDTKRKYGASHNSIKLIGNFMAYHVKFDNNEYQALLRKYLESHKSTIYKLFPMKQFQLNVEQTSNLQSILNINNNQMRKLQRFVRKCTNRILLCNEAILLDFQCGNDMLTAETLMYPFQVSTQYTNSRSQLPIQTLPVYIVDIRDALSRIISSALNHGDFYIHPTLSQNSIKIEIGCDKSDSGIAESVSAAVVRKHHGKFGSILTTLTDLKIAENYSNYRAISMLNNKREITNQMLLRPNCIILSLVCLNETNTVISKKFISFPMLFTSEEQERWNDKLQEELINCPSPQITQLNININQLPVLPDIGAAKQEIQDIQMDSNDNENCKESKENISDQNASSINQDRVVNNKQDMRQAMVHDSKLWMNDSHELDPGIRTNQYWGSKQVLVHFDRLYVVDLPAGFELKYPKDKWDNNLLHDCEQELNEWVIKVVKGETQIVHHEKQQQLSYSESSDDEQETAQNDIDMSSADVTVSTKKRKKHEDSDYVPNSADDSPSDHIIQVKKGKRKKLQVISKITVQHYSLNQFHFNGGSSLHRMDKCIWDQKSTCAPTKTAQSNNLHFIEWSSLTQCEDNSNVLLLGEPTKWTRLTFDTLWDDHRGVSFFWIPCTLLPDNYDSVNEFLFTAAIVHNNIVQGLVNCFIDDWDATDTVAKSHPGHRMCEINQRCQAFEKFSIATYNGINNTEKLSVCVSDDLNEMRRIGCCAASFDTQCQHEMKWWRMDLDAVSQYDNKGRNMVCGIAQATAKYFCSICDICSDNLRQLPRPTTLRFSTRTAESKQRNLRNGMNLENNEVNLIDSKGVQTQPLYNIPGHKHGGVTLHNMEGIWAVAMDTYQDHVCPTHGHKKQWNTLQSHCKLMDDKFKEIANLRDNINATNEYTRDREIRKWLDNAKIQLVQLEQEYTQLETDWKQMNETIADNYHLTKFKTILKKHNISLYYMLPGSVQGAVCGKLCKAQADLVDLSFELNQTGGYIWAHYFNNLSYIYDMLKHKSCRNWTTHELASVKTAYIDWYQLHVLAVSLWRMKGSTGVKCHYLLHDIEKCITNKCSPASEDDQRFENSNQIVDSGLKNYTRYKQRDKLHLLARKCNTRALNKPPR